MNSNARPTLAINAELFRPGLRVAVGLSGGADSVALLRALAARREELGLVLYAAHLHHGLRGQEADEDLEFCRALASTLDVPLLEDCVNAAAEADSHGETIEEAARRLRYGWFRTLLTKTPLHAVATAHTLDDQAETVLGKFLRGAWTEGLSGIHPTVDYPEGKILRPLLATTRGEIERYLRQLGQSWREDSTNLDPAYTRNRIRHELLPQLEGWNPQIRKRLAAMAELARDEENYLHAETAQLAVQLLLPGKPARGGGRATATGEERVLAIEAVRLAALPVAMQRRLIREAAARLGSTPAFEATEEIRQLALAGRAGQKRELEGGLRAERSHRELRLTFAERAEAAATPPEITFSIPGEVESAAYGVRLQVQAAAPATATLRPWRPGDRVRLRYSSAPRKVKEVLERLRVAGSERTGWPVLECGGRIVWMRGAEVEVEQGISAKEKPALAVKSV